MTNVKKKSNTKKEEKKTKVKLEEKEYSEEVTKRAKKDMFLEYGPYLIIIFFIIIIRTFIATPVRVSGSSMDPTLRNNDTMILYKLTKKVNGIKRFNIVVIQTDSAKLIKRVIGLPGDKIKYRIEDNKGVLYINDKKVKENFIDDDAKLRTCNQEWTICEDEIVVPENEYFVMGDNRGNSKDSRIIGTVEDEKILGVTNLVIFPFDRFGKVK